jgi:VWFA-related protein
MILIRPAAGLLAAVAILAAAGSLPARAQTSHPLVPARPHVEHVRVVDRPWMRVDLTVTVTDRDGRPLTGLARDEFTVTEGGSPVELADFGPEEGRLDRPLSVAVLLDLSGSMGSQVRNVEAAARALLGGLRPGDQIMVAKFNDQLTVLQPFTGKIDGLDRSLRSIGRAYGGTAIFRAIEKTLKDVRDRPGRKVILVVSDGLDNDLERSQPVLQSLYLQDLLRLCFRTQTSVYGVRPGMASSWTPFEGFVEQTGGRLVYTGGDLVRLFARLGEEFLSQYYLAYEIDPKASDSRWRRVRVQVDRPGALVSAMQGYFTPRDHLDTLLRDLDDREESVRADAAWDLGYVDDPRARAGLQAALEDRSVAVRRTAVDSLARLRETAAIPAIVALLGDGDEEVRGAAATALDGFRPASAGPLAAAVTAAAGRKRPGSAALTAAAVLGRVGDDRAIEPLTALLRGESRDGRLAAVRALAALGLGAGIGPLREALRDGDPEVRRAALEGIAAIAPVAARPVIEDHLTHEADPAVRAAALALLAGS